MEVSSETGTAAVLKGTDTVEVDSDTRGTILLNWIYKTETRNN